MKVSLSVDGDSIYKRPKRLYQNEFRTDKLSVKWQDTKLTQKSVANLSANDKQAENEFTKNFIHIGHKYTLK